MSESLHALLNRQDLDRAHQLLVAQRLAEVVETVHAAGGAIGNLDDHRVLVEPDGTVTLSDDASAAPEASTPAYTAPELQGFSMGRPRPEGQHDVFALAVLLFQLLMKGYHPYAGRWVGGGNLPDIPKAIQLGLYAYGGSSAVTPPPDAPALSTLEPGLADLFKRSFAATSATFRSRPTGTEWARALAAVQPDLLGTDGATSLEPLSTRKPDPMPETALAAPATSSVGTVVPPSEQGVRTPPLPLPQPAAHPAARPALPTLQPADPVPTVPSATTSPAATPAPTPGPRQFSRRAMLTGEVAARRAGPEPKSTLSHDLWLVSRLPQPLLRRLKQLQPFLHPEVYDLNRDRLLSLMAVGIFLFLFIKGRIGNNRDAAVPITQTLPTPISRPTVTSAFEVNPTVASFGSNFDVTDRVIPSTGERFSADVRDRALRLEAVGRGARGKVMFNAAPATADFHFTVQVGETTGQGEILIYVRKPDSERTWVFAIDPGASTWGLYEEPPWSNRPISVLDHIDYSSAIAGEPLRTITVTRKGGRTSLLINGATVSPRVAGSMPRIGGPVTVGIGAMIPDDPEYDESEPFVVTIDRVAMHADEP